MLVFQLTFFTLFALAQVAAVPPFAEDILDAKEKVRMGRAIKIEDRIKVYEAASKRIQQTLEAAVAVDDFSKAPDILKLWSSLLAGSLEDIETNLKTRKKSKPLIRYEIQVRKAIAACQGYKTKAPLDQQDLFASYLAQAEKVRKRFVEIIFQS